MTLHRPPPQPESTVPVEPPAPHVDAAGRWSWPDLLHYEIEGPPGSDTIGISPLPPHEPESREDTIARAKARLMLTGGQARTAPYRMAIHGGRLAQVDALARSGMLRDPRHTGVARDEVTDLRKAPGA